MNRQEAKSAEDARPMSGYARVPDRLGLREPPAELDALAHEVIGAAIEVHRHLGPGFFESVYENALCEELRRREIAFERQVPVEILYKGARFGEGRIDLLVNGQLIVELKAVEQLGGVHTLQTASYLKASGLQLGLVINFNVPRLADGVRRVIVS